MLKFLMLFLMVVAPVFAAPTNVVFCIADDASPHFGAYGCDWVKTPNIDAVAKAGVIFENAYTPTAKCAPARAAILTGRNPWLLEEAGNHQAFFPHKYKAFSEALSESGVHVGAYGKVWGPGKATHEDGSDRDFALASQKGGAGAGMAFKAFLSLRKAEQPFFFWFGSKNPHRPYKLNAGAEAGKKHSDIPHVPAYWPDNEVVRGDMLDYATEVEAYDNEVGEVISALKESGEMGNTLLIITSDHGMPFPRVKGHNYEMANHVPLIAHWPQTVVGEGRRVTDFLSFIDLAPTFLEVFGLSVAKAGLSPMSGRSFLDILRGKPELKRDFVLLGRERTDVYARAGSATGLGYPIRAIREGKYYYIHNFKADRWPCGDPDLGLLDTDMGPTKKWIMDSEQTGPWWQFNFGKRPEEELFDVSNDPDCVVNLAGQMAHKEALNRLKTKLMSELEAQRDPRVLGQGDVFDQYPTTKKGKGKEV